MAQQQQQEQVEPRADDNRCRDNGDQEQEQEELATHIVPLHVRVDDASQREVLLEFERDCIGGSVELGSGTGFVGLMIAACFKPLHVFLTDLRRTSTETRLLESITATSDSNDELEATEVGVILGTDVAYLGELYDP
ncbi:hypothetical protein KRP22_007098 [Phytophthora ramorum]|nr:hypothetical protein KRP22_1805 [Phytophthora ramorum]